MRAMRAAALMVALPLFASHPNQPKDVPSWVQEVTSRSLPALPARAPAAVLFDEQHVSVGASGIVTTTTRYAVKILTHEGQKEAAATE